MFTSPNTAKVLRDETLNAHRQTAQQQTDDHDRLITINQVADWLGVSKAWVYDHVTRKRPFLPCVRFGELTRFRKTEIEQFIQEHAKRHGTS
jgi:excisionase family DNA binding protein